jgi:amino acid transporter
MNSPSLKRALSTKDLVIYGIIFMIPIAPFAWYGSFLQASGGMVALAYLIGMAAMLFTGFSYAIMAGKYPISGSVYSYVQKGTNQNLGFLAGWAITLDYIFLPAVCYLVGGLFVAELTPGIPTWIWVLIFAVFNTIINALGVKLMAKVSWALFGLQSIVILYFIIGSIRLMVIGDAHFETISFYNPDNFNLHGVLQATAIVVLSYLGFDAVSTLSEEAKDPRKSIGRATILSIVLIGTLFVILSFFAGVVFPEYTKLNTDTAFLDILKIVGGKTLVNLSVFSIVLSFGVACGLEGQTAVARILYSMGRDGILPKAFGNVHAKYNTPFFSTIFVGILSFIVAILVSLDFLAGLLSFGALLGFMSLNLTVIWHFYVKGQNKSASAFIKYVISPLIGFLFCAYIFAGLGITAFIVGGIWLLLGLGYLIFVTKGFNKQAPQMEFSEVEKLEI